MPAVIVIGTSEGGVDALCSLAAALPAGFPAAVFMVLHIGANKSQLPALLNQAGPLPASHATDGEVILPGRIYVAPPDQHLVVEPGRMRLTRGPRENWARPAIDPLFRSAAQAYGTDAIGVILTGGLNDGTAGLFEIERCGGTTIVQDPADAANPAMPRSALEHVRIDHRTTLRDLPQLLVSLVGAKADAARTTGMPGAVKMGKEAMMADYSLDKPVAVTCPDCGGALRRSELGTLTQFRCHIGHVYTAEVMAAAQFAAMEWSVGAAMRALSERGELCRQIAEKTRTAGDAASADQWTTAMQEAKDRAAAVGALLESAWTHPGNTGSATPSGI